MSNLYRPPSIQARYDRGEINRLKQAIVFYTGCIYRTAKLQSKITKPGYHQRLYPRLIEYYERELERTKERLKTLSGGLHG